MQNPLVLCAKRACLQHNKHICLLFGRWFRKPPEKEWNLGKKGSGKLRFCLTETFQFDRWTWKKDRNKAEMKECKRLPYILNKRTNKRTLNKRKLHKWHYFKAIQDDQKYYEATKGPISYKEEHNGAICKTKCKEHHGEYTGKTVWQPTEDKNVRTWSRLDNGKSRKCTSCTEHSINSGC